MRKALPMSAKSLVPIYLLTPLRAIIVWQETTFLWFLGAMNTAHPYSLTLNERASTRVNSWHAITVKFVKYGIDWVCPGIYILKQEQKTTIALLKISFLRSTIRVISSKIQWNLPIAQRIVAFCLTAMLRAPAHIVAIHRLAGTSATIVVGHLTRSI